MIPMFRPKRPWCPGRAGEARPESGVGAGELLPETERLIRELATAPLAATGNGSGNPPAPGGAQGSVAGDAAPVPSYSRPMQMPAPGGETMPRPPQPMGAGGAVPGVPQGMPPGHPYWQTGPGGAPVPPGGYAPAYMPLYYILVPAYPAPGTDPYWWARQQQGGKEKEGAEPSGPKG